MMRSQRSTLAVLWQFLILIAVVWPATHTVLAAEGNDTSPGSPYPLSTCIVSGEKLTADGDPVVYNHEGREIRFCCNQCKTKFAANPADYLNRIDLAIADQQRPFYPTDTCVISREKLGGEMGDPIEFVYDNRLVQFCCKQCIGTFKMDPAAYLEKLDAAVIEAQAKDYPADTCPISGSKLGGMGDPYNHVFAGRLVQFCCGGCLDAFNADPTTAMAKVYGVEESKTAADSENPAPAASHHEDHDHTGH